MFESSRGGIAAVVAGACLVLATAAPQAGASVITVNPAADAFVSSSNASGNYGKAGGLSVAAAGLANGEFQTVMKFDASSAKSSFDSTYGAGKWTIQSVTLLLTAAEPLNPLFNSSAAGQFSVRWMQDDSWTEGAGKPASPAATGITYNTLPSFLTAGEQALGTFTFGGATSGQTAYDLTLASGFAADLAAGGKVSLRLLAADSGVSYVFNSCDFGTTTSRPVLSITASAPEPGTLALLAAGTLLLARCRRRGRP